MWVARHHHYTQRNLTMSTLIYKNALRTAVETSCSGVLTLERLAKSTASSTLARNAAIVRAAETRGKPVFAHSDSATRIFTAPVSGHTPASFTAMFDNSRSDSSLFPFGNSQEEMAAWFRDAICSRRQCEYDMLRLALLHAAPLPADPQESSMVLFSGGKRKRGVSIAGDAVDYSE